MTIPHCDLKTGKIYGCEKNSFLWWHEKGHFEFNKLDSTSSLKVFQNFAFAFWMFSISLINTCFLLLFPQCFFILELRFMKKGGVINMQNLK